METARFVVELGAAPKSKLKILAAKEGLTMSEIVRKLVDDFLEKASRDKAKTGRWLAAVERESTVDRERAVARARARDSR